MNMTRLSIKRPVGISMIVAFFVVLGLYSYYRIGVELLPALNTPYVTVSVKYPGASAESVEQEVVKPVEDALSSVSGVKKITSTARYERARVTLELDFATNADTAAIDASKKVEAIANKLPDEADSPVVIKRDMNAKPIVELAVLSDHSLADTYTETDNVFSEVIQQAGGVSEVELHGGRDREVAIDVDREKMAAYKLTLAKIAAAIKDENQLVPSGSVYTETTKSDVRVVAQFQKPSDIEKVQVENTAGKMIPLTAVATVREREARTERYGRLNGEDAINVLIYKNSDANVVETAANIMKSVEKLRKTYPDYQFVVVSNDADYVRDSLHSTMNTLIEGLITTGLVLFFFLRGWRSTAAVMIAIPTSLIATFFVMYLAGFTFNMMSLMGMTLCVGILVDDSIVVLENIVRHLKLGEAPDTAAEKGRTEIGMAAIAITLCDAAVFMPIAFMQGMTGQYFRQFGLTIVFAGAFSLFVSFTLTPMLASRFFRKGYHPAKNRAFAFMDRVEARAERLYVEVLNWSLRHTKKLLLSILAVFAAVVALVPLGLVGMEYMPQTDESSFTINIQTPVGSSPAETNRVAERIEGKLAEIPEVKYYMTQAGGSTAYEGRIKVQLVDRRERSRTVWQVANDVRAFAADIKTADVRVAETQTNVAGIAGGGGAKNGGGALQIELRSNDGAVLDNAAEKAMNTLKAIDGVTDVNSSYVEGMPELRLTVDREKLKASAPLCRTSTQPLPAPSPASPPASSRATPKTAARTLQSKSASRMPTATKPPTSPACRSPPPASSSTSATSPPSRTAGDPSPSAASTSSAPSPSAPTSAAAPWAMSPAMSRKPSPKPTSAITSPTSSKDRPPAWTRPSASCSPRSSSPLSSSTCCSPSSTNPPSHPSSACSPCRSASSAPSSCSF